MENFETNVNVSSIHEVLEAEKQEKINEVIQKAREEENDLEMMADPKSPEEWFDEIFEKLWQDWDWDDEKREIGHKKELWVDWVKYKKISITLIKTLDDNLWAVDELYVEYKKNGKSVNYCIRKKTEEDWTVKIQLKDLSDKRNKRMTPNKWTIVSKLREIYRVADAITKEEVEQNT